MDEKAHSGSRGAVLLIGMSLRARSLTVSHCMRNKGSTIRIMATKRE